LTIAQGAAAILEYNTIDSPLAQPRNLMLGHFLSAIVGIGITKLFALLPDGRFDDLRWLAGALAVGTSSLVMSVTKTIHPPAGATALLAATSPDITRLGWYLLPLVLLGSTLMLISACVINNIQRQFPIYWWTPVALDDEQHRRPSPGIERLSQAEMEEKSGKDHSRSSSMKTRDEIHLDPEHELKVSAKTIIIPDWLVLDDWEKNVLEIVRTRLMESVTEGVQRGQSGNRSPERTEASTDEEKAV
jgi:hypothetical protein